MLSDPTLLASIAFLIADTLEEPRGPQELIHRPIGIGVLGVEDASLHLDGPREHACPLLRRLGLAGLRLDLPKRQY